MDESKRRFIKQSVGLLAASGLAAGGAKHAEAVEPPDTPPSMKAPGPLCCLRAAPECHVEAAAPPLIWCEPSEEGETTYEEL